MAAAAAYSYCYCHCLLAFRKKHYDSSAPSFEGVFVTPLLLPELFIVAWTNRAIIQKWGYGKDTCVSPHYHIQAMCLLVVSRIPVILHVPSLIFFHYQELSTASTARSIIVENFLKLNTLRTKDIALARNTSTAKHLSLQACIESQVIYVSVKKDVQRGGGRKMTLFWCFADFFADS